MECVYWSRFAHVSPIEVFVPFVTSQRASFQRTYCWDHSFYNASRAEVFGGSLYWQSHIHFLQIAFKTSTGNCAHVNVGVVGSLSLDVSLT